MDFVNFRIGPMRLAADVNWLARRQRTLHDNALATCHAVAVIEGATLAVMEPAPSVFMVVRQPTPTAAGGETPCSSLATALAHFAGILDSASDGSPSALAQAS